MKYTPRPYQIIATDYLINNPRAALFAEMGLGKTVSTLQAITTVDLYSPGPTIILAPLRVAQSVWPNEIKKWDDLNHLSCSVITGDAEERLDALHKTADVYTMNYENLPWLLQWCVDNKFWPFTKIVADESTRLKSFRNLGKKKRKNPEIIKAPHPGSAKGLRARCLGKVAFHPKVTHFFELTGTPSPNGLQDLWGQVWFLDRGFRLGSSYTSFLQRWFTRANLYAPWIPLPHAQEEIHSRIKDLCLSLQVKDWFKLDETVIVDVPVQLPDKSMRLYKKMEKELFCEISGNEIEAANSAAKTMKCLQIANGAVYTDDIGNWEEIHKVKIDALESIIEEANNKPVLVAYHFKSDLARILKRFPMSKHLDQNPSTIDEWNKGEIPILLAHPASAGHGLNLADGGNILAIFGHWWDLEQYQQIIERIGPVRQAQAGHPRPVFVYNIRAEGTMDSVVISRRVNKRKVQDLLLEMVKGSG